MSQDEQRIFGVWNKDRSQVIIEQVKTGEFVKFKGHSSTVRALQVIESKSLLVSGGNDRQVIVWDYQERLRLHTFQKVHKGHVIALELGHDQSYFVSGSYDGTLRIFQIGECKKVEMVKELVFTNRVYSICLSPDGNLLFCGGYNKKFLRSWRAFRDKEDKSLQMIEEEKLGNENKDPARESLMESLLSRVYDLRDPAEMDQLYVSQIPKKPAPNEKDSVEELNSSLVNISFHEKEPLSKPSPSLTSEIPKKMFLSQIISTNKPSKYEDVDIRKLVQPRPKAFGLKLRGSRIQDSKADPVKRAYERSKTSKGQSQIWAKGLGRVLGKTEQSPQNLIRLGDRPQKFLESVLDSEQAFLEDVQVKMKKLKIAAEEVPECKQIKSGLGNVWIDVRMRQSRLAKTRIESLKTQNELVNSVKREHESRSRTNTRNQRSLRIDPQK